MNRCKSYRYASIVLVHFVASIVASPTGTSKAEEPFPIKPHAEIQALIHEWTIPAQDEAKEFRTIRRLRALAAEDNERFVLQVAYYVAHMKEKVLGSAVYRLFGYCRISEGTWVEVMSRYAYCANEQLRKDARRTLRGTPSGKYQNYRDLEYFAPVVRNEKVGDELAIPAKRWIFETAPNSAFLLFVPEADRKEWSRLRRLERVMSNALFDIQYMGGLEGEKISKETEDAVRELAKSPHWWARLFVAETIVQYREFRVADVIATLAKDSDPLVKQSIASLEKEDPLRATRVDTGRLPRLLVDP